MRKQFDATPQVIERLLPTAHRLGVAMGMEIHSPHTVEDPVMLELRTLYDQLDSPYVGSIPGFGASVLRHPPMLFEAFSKAGVPDNASGDGPGVERAGDPFARRLALMDQLDEMGVCGNHTTLVGKGFGLFGHQDPRAWSEIGDWIVHVHGKFFETDERGDEPAVPTTT